MAGQSKRYSTAFKRKVIDGIESGNYSYARARRVYHITGTATIQLWLRKYCPVLYISRAQQQGRGITRPQARAGEDFPFCRFPTGG